MTDTPDSGAACPRSLSWRKRWAAFPPAFQGLLLGSFAALCYSFTNVGLRQVAVRTDLDWAMWVASWKVMPTAVAGWFLMAGLARRGASIVPPRDILLWLIANGLLMQFCGNVLFQYGLSRAGLALSVPLCFASRPGLRSNAHRWAQSCAQRPKTPLSCRRWASMSPG